MKHPLDNQTVDWCEDQKQTGSKSAIAAFERFAAVIRVTRTTPIAKTRDIQRLALPDMTIRASQRYIKGLIDAGYLRRVGRANDPMGVRLLPTEKVKEVFGGAA